MRLTGQDAIEYAEERGLYLNKHGDSISGPRRGLSVSEARAIADDDPDLIWLEAADQENYFGPRTSLEPD